MTHENALRIIKENDLQHKVDSKMPTIISRDALVELYGTGNTYTEKFKSLTLEQNKIIDQELQVSFRDATKSGENIIVDMTNMSKKTRKKWLKNARGYFKVAKVFIESPGCLISRNTPEKFIPPEVTQRMMQNFVYPLSDEGFDKVDIV